MKVWYKNFIHLYLVISYQTLFIKQKRSISKINKKCDGGQLSVSHLIKSLPRLIISRWSDVWL